jgi:hypothetical protein
MCLEPSSEQGRIGQLRFVEITLVSQAACEMYLTQIVRYR